MPHKVMLVDDAAMMRLVISKFIASLPDFEFVALQPMARWPWNS